MCFWRVCDRQLCACKVSIGQLWVCKVSLRKLRVCKVRVRQLCTFKVSVRQLIICEVSVWYLCMYVTSVRDNCVFVRSLWDNCVFVKHRHCDLVSQNTPYIMWFCLMLGVGLGLGLKRSLFAHITIFFNQHLQGETKTQGKKMDMCAGAELRWHLLYLKSAKGARVFINFTFQWKCHKFEWYSDSPPILWFSRALRKSARCGISLISSSPHFNRKTRCMTPGPGLTYGGEISWDKRAVGWAALENYNSTCFSCCQLPLYWTFVCIWTSTNIILSLCIRLNVLDARHVKTRRPCRPLFANLSKLVLFSAVFALISGASRCFRLLWFFAYLRSVFVPVFLRRGANITICAGLLNTVANFHQSQV